MTTQSATGAARARQRATDTRRALGGQHGATQDAQPSFLPDPDAERERIAAHLAATFPTYGQGAHKNPRNALAVTLAGQPPLFAFGVKVRDVVDAVCDALGVLAMREPRDGAA
jgi:hypothetical protein